MKKIKDKQRFHDFLSVGLMIVLFFIGLARLPLVLQTGNMAHALPFMLSFIAIIGFMVVLSKSELKIKVNTKHLKIGIYPFKWTYLKMPFSKVQEVQPFETNVFEGAAKFLHFGEGMKVYNYGDDRGVIFTLTDGQQIVVFSGKLYDHCTEISASVA